MAKLAHHKRELTKALKYAGLYTPVTAITVKAVASALLSLDIANAEIEKMESVERTNTTTQGTTSSGHPAFKTQREMIYLIFQGMKQLGLTTSEVIGKPDIRDAADDLIDKVNSIK